MGLYATLRDASVECPACGAKCTGDWQFYFGQVSDLPTYRLGDSIRWDGMSMFGSRSMKLVWALAYNVTRRACKECKECKLKAIIAELQIRDGVLIDLTNPTARSHAEELLLEGEERIPRYHKDISNRP